MKSIDVKIGDRVFVQSWNSDRVEVGTVIPDELAAYGIENGFLVRFQDSTWGYVDDDRVKKFDPHAIPGRV